MYGGARERAQQGTAPERRQADHVGASTAGQLSSSVILGLAELPYWTPGPALVVAGFPTVARRCQRGHLSLRWRYRAAWQARLFRDLYSHVEECCIADLVPVMTRSDRSASRRLLVQTERLLREPRVVGSPASHPFRTQPPPHHPATWRTACSPFSPCFAPHDSQVSRTLCLTRVSALTVARASSPVR